MPPDRLSTFLSGLCAILMTVVLTACVSRPAESPEYRAVTPSEAITISEEDTPARRALLTAPRDTVNVLALSGGGSDGAYGVGVLNGWSRAGTRPSFDIVTGVSTGGLIAVLAFLGSQYDELLRDLYVLQTDSGIFKRKGISGFFSDSLYDNTPLKEQIERVITARIIDKVAVEHAKGRRLYLATVNLDANELVGWDMGLLASGGADGRTDRVQLFQKVMRASAAIPVFFPPVYIKPKRGIQLRQAHVDGAIKAPVLLGDFVYRVPARKRNVYVIINGSLALRDAFRAVQPNIRSIASNAVGGLTRELTQQTVYRGYARARNTGSNFFLTAIPDEIRPLADPLAFDREHLELLYTAGERAAQRDGFWWRSPPHLKDSDLIAAN